MKIPSQLMVPEFRFFLIKKNSKLPIDKEYNTKNCWMFFESKVLNHVLRGGNLGILAGYGGLIVIDFDDVAYQAEKEKLLPPTFTVKTPGKGLKHFYYILKGEMIRKEGIDRIPAGLSDRGTKKQAVRICDILAGKAPVVCPPSIINKKYYCVVNDVPIAEIDCNTLTRVFGIKYFKQPRIKKYDKEEIQPQKIQEAIDLLVKHNVERYKPRHFKCPFHDSHNNQNMYILNNGSIYCFHCQSYWKDVHKFIDELNREKEMQEIVIC